MRLDGLCGGSEVFATSVWDAIIFSSTARAVASSIGISLGGQNAGAYRRRRPQFVDLLDQRRTFMHATPALPLGQAFGRPLSLIADTVPLPALPSTSFWTILRMDLIDRHSYLIYGHVRPGLRRKNTDKPEGASHGNSHPGLAPAKSAQAEEGREPCWQKRGA
jgi:hypothetical protein